MNNLNEDRAHQMPLLTATHSINMPNPKRMQKLNFLTYDQEGSSLYDEDFDVSAYQHGNILHEDPSYSLGLLEQLSMNPSKEEQRMDNKSNGNTTALFNNPLNHTNSAITTPELADSTTNSTGSRTSAVVGATTAQHGTTDRIVEQPIQSANAGTNNNSRFEFNIGNDLQRNFDPLLHGRSHSSAATLSNNHLFDFAGPQTTSRAKSSWAILSEASVDLLNPAADNFSPSQRSTSSRLNQWSASLDAHESAALSSVQNENPVLSSLLSDQQLAAMDTSASNNHSSLNFSLGPISRPASTPLMPSTGIGGMTGPNSHFSTRNDFYAHEHRTAPLIDSFRLQNSFGSSGKGLFSVSELDISNHIVGQHDVFASGVVPAVRPRSSNETLMSSSDSQRLFSSNKPFDFERGGAYRANVGGANLHNGNILASASNHELHQHASLSTPMTNSTSQHRVNNLHSSGNTAPTITSNNNLIANNSHNHSNNNTIEFRVASTCREILIGAAEHSLKAVELANTLRARVGTEVLSQIREKWGGLLALLEKQQSIFLVERIPKNDRVSLLQSGMFLDLTVRGVTTPPLAMVDGVDGHSPLVAGINSTASNRIGGTHNASNMSDGSIGSDFNINHNSMNEPGDNTYNTSNANNSNNNNLQPTRCLHIGNVPPTMTEIQLLNDFERFGTIDGLKIVSQKNGYRRFAFITYATVDQAITARHCLSKVAAWKGTISFAHKEIANSNITHGNGGNGDRHNNNPQFKDNYRNNSQPAAFEQYSHNNNNNNSYNNNNHTNIGYNDHNLNNSWGQPYDTYPPNALNHFNAYDLNAQNVMLMSNYSQNPAFYASPAVNFPPNINASNNFNSSIGGNNNQPINYPNPVVMNNTFNNMHNNDNSYNSSVGVNLNTSNNSNNSNCPVLQRLCDDTYVPTQPWPRNYQLDHPYCQAIALQLQQFNSSTTISKLRGFLRNRVASTENIKSVPLKALLAAYPEHFVVVNNHVTLIAPVF